MLIGEQRCSLDDKGRMNFPARFREELGESFIITRWVDNCLVAMPDAEWQRMSAVLKSKSAAKTREIKRFLHAGAFVANPDKQGRILIPALLREHAGLAKELAVIGTGEQVEIWDADRWQALNEQMSSEDIALAMEELEL